MNHRCAIALVAAGLTIVLATSASAQPRPPARPAPPPPKEPVSVRAFVLGTEQEFLAKTTFDAAFGRASGPFWGAGGEVTFRNYFVNVSVSRFKKDGQRAVAFNGEVFPLGIPLTATLTPVEVAGGYRFHFRRHRALIPYVGAGIGSYGYAETCQPDADRPSVCDAVFASATERLDVRHVGALAVGGVEFRLAKWLGIAADLQYTHIPGILGEGGVSKDVNERDLGGIAGRARFIIGR